MADIVVILEDESRRVDEMRQVVSQVGTDLRVMFFDRSQVMIGWLEGHLHEALLISLDHDLLLQDEDGRSIDCGTGRDVVDFLVARRPVCPVIVHSSNLNCAAGMMHALKDAGWQCSRSYPADDLGWIRSDWAKLVGRYLRPAGGVTPSQ